MAMPSVLLQLARNNPKIKQIKQMMNAVQSAQNPQAMLSQMAMNNPQLKQVMDIVEQYGGDPNKALQAIAEQHGFTPQDIMSLFD